MFGPPNLHNLYKFRHEPANPEIDVLLQNVPRLPIVFNFSIYAQHYSSFNLRLHESNPIRVEVSGLLPVTDGNVGDVRARIVEILLRPITPARLLTDQQIHELCDEFLPRTRAEMQTFLDESIRTESLYQPLFDKQLRKWSFDENTRIAFNRCVYRVFAHGDPMGLSVTNLYSYAYDNLRDKKPVFFTFMKRLCHVQNFGYSHVEEAFMILYPAILIAMQGLIYVNYRVLKNRNAFRGVHHALEGETFAASTATEDATGAASAPRPAADPLRRSLVYSGVLDAALATLHKPDMNFGQSGYLSKARFIQMYTKKRGVSKEYAGLKYTMALRKLR
jgi:hypothetical protein